MIFRKRILRPVSSIGYHLQEKDEIYYIASGQGELTMNGKTIMVNAGDAILIRAGNSHGLKPVGNDSLTVIINYNKWQFREILQIAAFIYVYRKIEEFFHMRDNKKIVLPVFIVKALLYFP